MAKLFLLSIYSLLYLSTFCQKKDTIRIYRYELVNKFTLTVKNNKNFIYVDRNSDTFRGVLVKQRDRFILTTDTIPLDKWQKKHFANINKAIWLEINARFKMPLMHFLFDTFLGFDTFKLQKGLEGHYAISNRFTGCEVNIDSNMIKFQPFADVGGKEETESSLYIKNRLGIKLVGKSYIDKWFTDNKQFFILPHLLIGRKISSNAKTYTETYRYFIKTIDD